MLEHLASTIFCGRLIPLQPNFSLARRCLAQRQVSSRETQLDPHSLLYRLTKQPEVSSLNLMYGMYLDDATLGDSPDRVHDDLVVLLERLRAIGLEFNGSKCELTIFNDSMPEATDALFRGLLPGVRAVEACDLSLLGAPVYLQGIPGSIHEKREALERMTSKLEVLNPHQAFVLLKNAFVIPKLQYVLRASSTYLCGEKLNVFDRALFLFSRDNG